MKTKTFNLLLCIIAVASFLMISCSEDLGFGDSMKTDNSYVQLAKQIFQNQGSAVSMPNPKADKAPASRSSMSYQYDGDLIYAHHKDYRMYVVQKDYFNSYENIAIRQVLLADPY